MDNTDVDKQTEKKNEKKKRSQNEYSRDIANIG